MLGTDSGTQVTEKKKHFRKILSALIIPKLTVILEQFSDCTHRIFMLRDKNKDQVWIRLRQRCFVVTFNKQARWHSLRKL